MKKCQASDCDYEAKVTITFNWKPFKVCDIHKHLDGSHFYYDVKRGGQVQCRCKVKGHK